jgi:cytochrome oxidase Cu insertion factor (SCO1/SenC/PrrC family)
MVRPRDILAGWKPGPRLPRRVAMVMAMLLAALGARAAAAPLDDLLFDLNFAPLDGKPAPPFTLAGLDGKPVSLAEFKGRVLLLYFWATW